MYYVVIMIGQNIFRRDCAMQHVWYFIDRLCGVPWYCHESVLDNLRVLFCSRVAGRNITGMVINENRQREFGS